MAAQQVGEGDGTDMNDQSNLKIPKQQPTIEQKPSLTTEIAHVAQKEQAAQYDLNQDLKSLFSMIRTTYKEQKEPKQEVQGPI